MAKYFFHLKCLLKNIIPKWNSILLATRKFIISAVVIIYTFPFFFQFLERFEGYKKSLVIPILGSLIYLICYLVVKMACPSLIKRHKNKENYQEWCSRNTSNLNIYDEFSFIDNIGAETIKKSLEEKNYLYPLSRGENYSKSETITTYSSLKYDYLNHQMAIVRFFLSLFLGSSVVMILFSSLKRLAYILGSS